MKLYDVVSKPASFLKNTAKFSLLTLSGYGIYAYFADKWPFREVGNEYEPTEWVTGHKGPVLKGPRTAWYVSPLVKLIQDEQGNSVKIPTYDRDKDFSLHYTTETGLEGDMRFQYRYVIPSRKDATKFYWNANLDLGLVDEAVQDAISKKLTGMKGMKITSDGEHLDDYLDKAVHYLNGEKVQKIREGEDAGYDQISKEASPYLSYGVKVVSIEHMENDPDDKSAEALRIPFVAKQRAEADLTRANATYKTAIINKETSRVYFPNASEEKLGEAGLILAGMDNQETIASNSNNATLVSLPPTLSMAGISDFLREVFRYFFKRDMETNSPPREENHPNENDLESRVDSETL